jgi:hypothetical protein
MNANARRLATAALAALALVAACPGPGPAAAGIDPARFGARVDNPWFPLKPGTTWVFEGVKDGKRARDVVTVSRRTAMVGGVRCAVVEDRLYLAGRLHERTTDWYSQDDQGSVWYFGEQTAELDNRGRVASTEGSWQAGRDGAEPGIFMPARPQVGRSYRQEFYRGHAEDHFRIIGLFGAAATPAGANALLTLEWTPLEPAVRDHKLYVRGVGVVLEQTVKGGDERLELVSMRRGS